MSIVYRATNLVNNKVYVGYTKYNLHRRMTQHLNKVRKNCSTKFYNAIRYYGANNFVWEVIFESWDDEYCHTIAEPQLIAEYNSIQGGYNVRSGGLSGRHTIQSKIQQGERAIKALKGKTYEEIHGVERAQELRAIRKQKRLTSYECKARDNTVFKLYNLNTLDVFQGTKLEFRKKYPQVNNLRIYNLCNGVEVYHKGWILDANNNQNFVNKLVHNRSYCLEHKIPFKNLKYYEQVG